MVGGDLGGCSVSACWLGGSRELFRACDLESSFPPRMRVEKLWNSVPNSCVTFPLKSALTSQISNRCQLWTDPRPQSPPQPQEGWGRGVSGSVNRRAASSSSLQGALLCPLLFVVHPTFISSLWKNHKMSQGCNYHRLGGRPGPQARSTRGSRVNDFGVRGTV